MLTHRRIRFIVRELTIGVGEMYFSLAPRITQAEVDALGHVHDDFWLQVERPLQEATRVFPLFRERFRARALALGYVSEQELRAAGFPNTGLALLDDDRRKYVAHMATHKTPETTRERVIALHTDYPELTATDIGRQLGISRQRVAELAKEAGIELPKYSRASVLPSEMAGSEERVRAMLQQLRTTISQATQLEQRLTKRLAPKRARRKTA